MLGELQDYFDPILDATQEKKKTWLQALSLLYINRFGLYAKYRDYAAGKLGAIPIQ